MPPAKHAPKATKPAARRSRTAKSSSTIATNPVKHYLPVVQSSSQQSLGQTLTLLHPESNQLWADIHWKDTLTHVIKTYHTTRVLELEACRLPSFTQNEVEALGIEYSASTAREADLAATPAYIKPVMLDIAHTEFVPTAQFDLIISHGLFHRVPSAPHAYAHILKLLRPGGVVLSHVPVLFAPAHVWEYAMPANLKHLAKRLLRQPPGEPAARNPYHWCRASQSTAQRLYGMGFSDVHIQPFYGEEKTTHLPFIGKLNTWLTHQAQKHDWRCLASHAYILARKPF
jgi:SAM-dependent methyltransferase